MLGDQVYSKGTITTAPMVHIQILKQATDTFHCSIHCDPCKKSCQINQ